MRLRAALDMKLFSGLIFTALLLFAQFQPARAESATDSAVLTVRTRDGLVVLHGGQKTLSDAGAKLGSALSGGATNAALLGFLDSSGLSASITAESYVSLPGGSGPAKATIIETTVKQAQLDGTIPAIEGLPLYEAYMLVRMRGDAFMILSDPPPQSVNISRSAFVFSSTWGLGLDGIFIDGVDRSKQKTGYNFVALAPDGKTIAGESAFETFSDAGASSKMRQFLESQPDGTFVLGAIKVGPGVYISGEAVNALRNYGSTNEPNSQVLSTNAFIGRKNARPGDTIEQSFVNGSSKAIVFGASLYVKTGGGALSPPPGARIVAISGTMPGDKVVIAGSAR